MLLPTGVFAAIYSMLEIGLRKRANIGAGYHPFEKCQFGAHKTNITLSQNSTTEILILLLLSIVSLAEFGGFFFLSDAYFTFVDSALKI